jgi:hypothetical protein
MYRTQNEISETYIRKKLPIFTYNVQFLRRISQERD